MRLKTVLLAALTVLLLAPMAADGQPARPDPIQGESQQLAYARLKLWLAGPYSTGSMTTFLVAPTQYIPLSQPYADAAFDGTPMDYDGSETVTDFTGPRASVVDWVLVELRTTSAAASAIATKAGLLMSDGLIRHTDGTTDLVFSGVASGDYFVVVRHRNHVQIMSSGVVTLSGTAPATLYDMTLAANIFGSGGAKDLGSGAFGLFAGDANGSGGTGAEDQSIWLGLPSATGYLRADYNLSGGTGSEDQSIWLGNPSVSTLVPEN